MATNSETTECIALLVNAYPKASIEPRTVKVYCELLADIPGVELRAAVVECVRRETFFPAIAEIRSFWRAARGTDVQRAARELRAASEANDRRLLRSAEGNPVFLARELTGHEPDLARFTAEACGDPVRDIRCPRCTATGDVYRMRESGDTFAILWTKDDEHWALDLGLSRGDLGDPNTGCGYDA